MDTELDPYYQSNITIMLKKITEFPINIQEDFINNLNYETESLLGYFIATENPKLLNTVFNNKKAHDNFFKHQNTTFFLDMALSTSNWAETIGVLIKNNYSMTGTVGNHHRLLNNFSVAISSFAQRNPEKILELINCLKQNLNLEQTNNIKENVFNFLYHTATKKNTDTLFKFFTILGNDLENTDDYQDKHLINLVAKNPEKWLTILMPDRFLHIKKNHPIKQNFYSIVKTILEKNPGKRTDNTFLPVVDSALSSSTQMLFLKTLVDLKVIIPMSKLTPRFFNPSLSETLFNEYIKPLWNDIPVSEHLEYLKKAYEIVMPDKYNQNRYPLNHPLVFQYNQEILNRMPNNNDKDFDLFKLLKNKNQEELESLFLKSTTNNNKINTKNKIL